MADGTGGFSRMVGRVGGGIFAKTAKTLPLQSSVAGISMRDAALQTPLRRFLNRDAARHIATNARPNAALRINRPKRRLRQP